MIETSKIDRKIANSMTLTAIKYDPQSITLSLLDQRKLPSNIEYILCKTYFEVMLIEKAIVSMVKCVSW